MSETGNGKPLLLPECENAGSYLGKYAEVISEVKMRINGATITVQTDPDSLGQILIEPDETEIAGGMFSEVESCIIFNPCFDNDKIQFLAEHSRHWRAKAERDMERAANANREQAEQQPPKIVAGAAATDSLNKFALK